MCLVDEILDIDIEALTPERKSRTTINLVISIFILSLILVCVIGIYYYSKVRSKFNTLNS